MAKRIVWAVVAGVVAMTFLLSGHSEATGLYDNAPTVQSLTDRTFNRTVTDKDYYFFINLYADWCPHSQNAAPTVANFSRSVAGWHKVLRIGAVNCAENDVCDQLDMHRYPTFLLIPPNTQL